MTTTPDEVWQLLRELIESQKETDRQLKENAREIKELRASQKESAHQFDREMQELRESRKESAHQFDHEMQELRESRKESARQFDREMQELRESQKETARQLKETDRELRESQKAADREMQELREIQKETAREIKELGKQIGGLGKKFGSFTEGMALPSMETLLRETFKMEVISPSIRVRKGGKELQLDVLAYNNGDLNTAYIVEVKSHAREEAIPQLDNILQRFRTFFPEHQHRTLYGILAAVDISAELREKALQAGFYVARIHDELFELDTPETFIPKAY